MEAVAGIDIVRRDIGSPELEIVSVNAAGEQADDDGWAPALSADGRFLAFESWAGNLHPLGDDGEHDVYVRDLETGVIAIASPGGGATASAGAAGAPAISGNGSCIVYTSDGFNLVPFDENGVDDVFVFVQAPRRAGDLDDDGDVDVDDLARLLLAWGPCGGACPEDLDGNGGVGMADLSVLLAGWS